MARVKTVVFKAKDEKVITKPKRAAEQVMKNYSPFLSSKIAHLKRMGLVSHDKTGTGENGGACPDWLKSAQESRRKVEAKTFAKGFEKTDHGRRWLAPSFAD